MTSNVSWNRAYPKGAAWCSISTSAVRCWARSSLTSARVPACDYGNIRASTVTGKWLAWPQLQPHADGSANADGDVSSHFACLVGRLTCHVFLPGRSWGDFSKRSGTAARMQHGKIGEEDRIFEIANLAAHSDATGRGGKQGMGEWHRRYGTRDVGVQPGWSLCSSAEQ
jgi:hypothetical protein